MARIRYVKPEFWSDEKMAPMRPLERLVFLGLICMADDKGRLVDNWKTIDGLLFPETDDSARESLEVLANAGRIIRYTSASGQKLIQLANWKRHQKVSNPSKYNLPAPLGEIDEDVSDDAPDDRTSLNGESHASLSRSSGDSRLPIIDHRPSTIDHRSSKSAGAAPPHPQSPLAVAGPIRELLDRCYPATDTQRRRQVERQMRATLTSKGCRLEGSEYVRAYDQTQLQDACAYVLKLRLREPDAAIRLVLLRLRDTYLEWRSSAEKGDPLAADVKAGTGAVPAPLAYAQQLECAREWAAERPELAAEIEQLATERLGDRATNGRELQRSIDDETIARWRDAGFPIHAAAHGAADPGGTS
jgi:hypothetical protein